MGLIDNISNFFDQLSTAYGQFFAGVIAGTTILAIEIEFLLSDLVLDAFSKSAETIPTTNSYTQSILLGFPLLTVIFIGVDLFQNLYIGYKMPKWFSIGFILTDIGVFFIFFPVWYISPAVIIGMFLSIIALIIGLSKNPTY